MHLSFHEDINFAQDLLITSPFNHAYRIAIELNLKLRRHWNETKYGSIDIVLGTVLTDLGLAQCRPTIAV